MKRGTPRNDHLLNIRKFYMHRFFEYLSTTKTHLEAYELTEKDYQRIYDTNKYRNYNSFRNAKSRYMSDLKTM